MISHIYYRNAEGGYYYRMYPKLHSWDKLIRIGNDSKQSKLFPDLFAPADTPQYENDKTSFHGAFLDKKKDNDKFFIALHTVAEIKFFDHIINECESRTLSSVAVIDVPENIYNYKFLTHEKYLITTENVYVLKSESA